MTILMTMNKKKKRFLHEQDLRIVLDRKKTGKVVTTIIDFIGSKEDLKTLEKNLKPIVGLVALLKTVKF